MENKHAVQALAALAQDSRLAIYRLLVETGPDGLTVGTIAERIGIANATLSFHLKELANAGLVDARQSGRSIIYSANFASMNALITFLTDNCCAGSGSRDCSPASSCNPASAKTVTSPKRKAK